MIYRVLSYIFLGVILIDGCQGQNPQDKIQISTHDEQNNDMANAENLWNISKRYQNGNHGEKNITLAKKYFNDMLEILNKDNTLKNPPIPENTIQISKFDQLDSKLELACNDDPYACFDMGNMLDTGFIDGIIVIKDQEEARKWYQKSLHLLLPEAKKGNPKAQYYLSQTYHNLVPLTEMVTNEQSLLWLYRAARNAHTDAQYEWARILASTKQTDTNKRSIDLNLLKKIYKTVEKGLIETVMDSDEIFLKQIQKQAYDYFLTATLKGHHEAMEWMTVCYSQGIGVEASTKKALLWELFIAKHGNTFISESLAEIPLQDYGIDPKWRTEGEMELVPMPSGVEFDFRLEDEIHQQ